jgi:hypothetical protein
LPDGKAKVASQSHGTTLYHIVNGECSCKDYAKAPCVPLPSLNNVCSNLTLLPMAPQPQLLTRLLQRLWYQSRRRSP